MQGSFQHAENLMKTLYSYYLNEVHCDLTIKLKDGEVKVHSLILLASSEYFTELLSNNSQMIFLLDVNIQDMRQIVRYIYTGDIEVTDQDDCKEIKNILKRFCLWPHDSDDKEYKSGNNLQNAKSFAYIPDKIHITYSEEFHDINISASDSKKLTSDDVTNCDSDSQKKEKNNLTGLSRDIVEEALMAAMDMEFVDTVGNVSTENCETNKSSEQKLVNRTRSNQRKTNTSPKSKTVFDLKNESSSFLTSSSGLPNIFVNCSLSESNKDTMTPGLALDKGPSGKNKEKKEITSNFDSPQEQNEETNDKKLPSNAISESNEEELEPLVRKDNNDVLSVMVENKSPSGQSGKISKTKTSNNEDPFLDGVVCGLRSRNCTKPRKRYSERKISETSNDRDGNVTCGGKSLDELRVGNETEDDCDKGGLDSASVSQSNAGRSDAHTCLECGRMFKSLKLVAGHRHSKHNVAFDSSKFKVYKCKDCEYETLEVHRLVSHEATSHSSKRPHSCEWCGKTFKLLGALTLHTNIHTKARKHECLHCSKVFSQHGTMKRHVEEKHYESHRHKCDACQFSAQDRVKLIQHKYNVHSIPLPSGYTIYRCTEDGCHFETFRKQILIGHVNTHKGVQEYTCSVCQKQFASVGNLRSHRTVHKEKSLHCSYPDCDFSTQLKNRLAQHVKLIHTHRDEKPYLCEFCPYRTAVKGNLLKHQRNIHSGSISKANSSQSKGDNSQFSVMGDNSVLITSGGLLKTILFSSGKIQLVDATMQTSMDSCEQLENAVSSDAVFEVLQ